MDNLVRGGVSDWRIVEGGSNEGGVYTHIGLPRGQERKTFREDYLLS